MSERTMGDIAYENKKVQFNSFEELYGFYRDRYSHRKISDADIEKEFLPFTMIARGGDEVWFYDAKRPLSGSDGYILVRGGKAIELICDRVA